jgi:acyl-CoA thioester hydrolase
MARIKIILPPAFSFTCTIPIRISDVNYGGHVGNDAVLSIIHEARMQFFKSLGGTELNLFGKGLIMTDAAIEFKAEMFYGDMITASVTIAEVSAIGFEQYYKLEKETSNGLMITAIAKTGMVCYDYEKKKVVAVPEEIKKLTVINS